MRLAHLSALGDTTRRSGVTPGPPNFIVGPRWSLRSGARSPGAYVPGTAGVCGSMVADHT